MYKHILRILQRYVVRSWFNVSRMDNDLLNHLFKFTTIKAKFCFSLNMNLLTSYYLLNPHTWSPHSLMAGMLTSSTNTSIFFPAGGPYVVPMRLST